MKNEAVEVKATETEFDLSVEYSRTVQEMIDVGNYGCINSKITEEHFPLPTELNGKQVSVSTKLFHFNRSISSEDAIAEMDKVGYRPATLAELLSLDGARPELQKEFCIVALGSVWRNASDDRLVPFLGLGFDGRELNLSWFGNRWPVGYRLLGVRK